MSIVGQTLKNLNHLGYMMYFTHTHTHTHTYTHTHTHEYIVHLFISGLAHRAIPLCVLEIKRTEMALEKSTGLTFVLVLCTGVLSACISVHYMCALGVYGGQKRMSDLL